MQLDPTTLPIEDVQLIIDDVRGGKLATDRTKFGKAVWELAGYALKVTLGEVGPVPVPAAPKSEFNFFGSSAPLSDREAADLLEQVIAAQTPGVATAMPIPWMAILKWALSALAAAL
jgi:hypothetical protein